MPLPAESPSIPYLKGQKVKVIDSIHSHIPVGMEGVIEDYYPKHEGYAVFFEKTIHVNGSGGGTEYKDAVVFMPWSHLEVI